MSSSHGIMLSLQGLAVVTAIYVSTGLRAIGDVSSWLVAATLLYAAMKAPTWLASKWMWWAITGALVADIVTNPLGPANHHYVLAYTTACAALTCSLRVDQQEHAWALGCRGLLVVAVLFAGLQKLCSNTFVDGSFMSFMLARGAFFEPILRLWPDAWSAIELNRSAMHELLAAAPSDHGDVPIAEPFPQFQTVAYALSVFTIVIELAVPWVILFVRNARLRNAGILGFLASVAVLRPEFGFLSLLAVLGLGQCPTTHPRTRTAYFVATILLSAGILSDFGYH